MKNPFRDLTKFEKTLWFGSVLVVTGSFLEVQPRDYLSLIASLIGVTALIFVAKGYVLGQVLTLVFSLFYGVISLQFRYYGEVLTYMGMTAPMAVLAIISWVRHPYGKTAEMEVHRMTGRQTAVMLVLSVLVTILFYFILGVLGTARLLVSSISVTTSFLACYMTFMRSPFYALGYAANDLVLIVLWVMAAAQDMSSLPMVACFAMFFLNDTYGLYNWRRMERRQKKNVPM